MPASDRSSWRSVMPKSVLQRLRMLWNQFLILRGDDELRGPWGDCGGGARCGGRFAGGHSASPPGERLSMIAVGQRAWCSVKQRVRRPITGSSTLTRLQSLTALQRSRGPPRSTRTIPVQNGNWHGDTAEQRMFWVRPVGRSCLDHRWLVLSDPRGEDPGLPRRPELKDNLSQLCTAS